MKTKTVNFIIGVLSVLLTMYFIVDAIEAYRHCSGTLVRAAFVGFECIPN
ncbi:hypothetical protein OAA60_03410 [Porticoccaceae bacterium]|nr:hypothetical protein [Porticoccaceae bacterium]